MRASETNLLRFLEPRNQFFIPIFQRRYSWEKHHCEHFWDDILRIGQNDEIQSYFLGSIVYMRSEDAPIGTVSRFLVIDGQQRLTTLTLLILALGRSVNQEEIEIGITQDQLSNFYLFNNMTDNELRYKLLLTENDKDILIQLLEDTIESMFPTTESSHQLVKNYEFFVNKLNPSNLKAIYDGIQKLMIVEIILQNPNDNAQLIFDSLNSTGLELSQTDRIRNYILMGQEYEFQNQLYNNYWTPIENRFGNDYANWFDWYIRDYLTLKTRKIPNINSVYEKFKEFIPTTTDSGKLQRHVEDIDRYSKHYVKFSLLKEDDPNLLRCFENIDELGAGVARPFFLEIYDDYMKGSIQKSEFIDILNMVESYVFRRVVCDIPTNSLNTTFASRLLVKIDKNNYLISIKKVLLNLSEQSSRYRFPSNSEFNKALQIRDVYNFKRRDYLLRKLENYRRKEPISLTDYTVEHIMPQNPNLRKEWQHDLGENYQEIQKKYLHTIGNITLTGYNSEMSDRPFHEKRDASCVGFKYSPLHLNRSVARAERWNEIAIQKRAEELAEKALNIWIYPE